MFVTFLLHVNIDVMLSNLELKYFAGIYRSTRYFFHSRGVIFINATMLHESRMCTWYFSTASVYWPNSQKPSQFHHSTFGPRTFLLADPTVWNLLPDMLHDLAVGSESFKQDLKTHHFVRH